MLFPFSYFDGSILVCYYTFSQEKPVVLTALALCGAMVSLLSYLNRAFWTVLMFA